MPVKTDITYEKEPMSRIRKAYFIRLFGRFIILVLTLLIFIFRPQELSILEGFNFFKRFSVFHLLWGIWLIDMIFQLIPVKNVISIGSQKLFKLHFRPLNKKINYKALKDYITATTKAAYKVVIIWVAFVAAVGVLVYLDVLSDSLVFLISVGLYVFDLIFVLIWCPFRAIMKTRCCTTCRIFNWDHLMIFSPMVFIFGFFSISLVVLAAVVLIVWELCLILYPERFWDQTNEALQCAHCTDKLCTQYCGRRRKQ